MCITASGGVVVAVASPKVTREGLSSFAVKERALTSVSVYATTTIIIIIIMKMGCKLARAHTSR